MMKKLLILMLVFGMASLANAEMQISVDGVVNPPDTEIVLYPSDTVVIDIMGDGRPQPVDPWLLIEGPGSIAGYTMLYEGTLSYYRDLAEVTVAMGMPDDETTLAAFRDFLGMPDIVDLSGILFADAPGGDYPLLSGKLVDDIIFHCEGLGDVTLTLMDGAFAVLDTVIIHQIPEPMTVLLLGLGGLFLRRRR